MLTQLNPPLPLWIPDKGQSALAHAVIDYGPEHNLLWVCFQDDGEIWCLDNTQVRAQQNITLGRMIAPKIPAHEA